MKIFLAGEGKTELGRHAREKEYADADDEVGVLEEMARRHCRVAEIVGAALWKGRVPKLKVGAGIGSAEEKTVRGLALIAAGVGAQVLVFVRDRDGKRDRQRDVEAGLSKARGENPSLSIVGGIAIEMIENWLLALRGERGSEACSDPKGDLAKRHKASNLEQKVELVRQAKLDEASLPADAASLRSWLEQAREVFGPPASPA